MKTLTDSVLCSLKPKTFYRAADLAQEMHIEPEKIQPCLRELSRGG